MEECCAGCCGAAAELKEERICRLVLDMDKTGKVYLVGAGPGDAGLITVKGRELLRQCDVVVYDRLAGTMLLNEVPEHCECIYVGKRVGSHPVIQPEINRILVQKANERKMVVRLKGGDSFVFGRGGEEVEALEDAGIPYEVIPGVTSAIAAAESAGIPVTHRGVSRSVHIVTGHTAQNKPDFMEDYSALARVEGTLVFLMGLGNLPHITEELQNAGKAGETPVAVIERATTRRQRVVRGTLADIVQKVKQEAVQPPSVVVVGEVAKERMLWDGKKTKAECGGLRVGVTGTRHMTEKLSRLLDGLGAEVVNMNYMRVVKEENISLADKLDCHWMAFTSANGVQLFFKQLQKEGIDIRALAGIRIAVIGEGTKTALSGYGVIPDYMPEQYTTNALADGLAGKMKKNQRILLPRARQGVKELPDILGKNGIIVEDMALYDVVYDRDRRDAAFDRMDEVDYLTFSSASGVRGFFDGQEDMAREVIATKKVICIGETTKKACESYGVKDVAVAEECSAGGLRDKLTGL